MKYDLNNENYNINFKKLGFIFLWIILSYLLLTHSVFAGEDLDEGIQILAKKLESQIVEKVDYNQMDAQARIAVMDVLEDNTNKRLELSNYIESNLTSLLVQSSKLKVLDREKTLQVRDIIEKPIREIAGTPLVPKGVNFKYVITGKILALGEEYHISVQVLALKNAEILASTQVKINTQSIPHRLLGEAKISRAELELSEINRADALIVRGDINLAIKILENFPLKFPNSSRKAEVQTKVDQLKLNNTEASKNLRAAELLMAQKGMELQSRTYLNRILKNYPKLPEAITATGLFIVLDLREDLPDSLAKSFQFEAEHLQHPVTAKIKLERSKYQERQEIKKQTTNATQLLAEGEAYYKNDKIIQARESFQKVVYNHAETDEAEKAKKMLEQMDQDESKAIEILKVVNILVDNPQTFALAKIEIDKIRQNYPKTLANIDATGYSIIINFKEKKDATREAAYFLVNHPNHKLVPEVKKQQIAFNKVSGPTTPGAEELKVAKKMLENNLIQQALQTLEKLKNDYPASPIGIEAHGLMIVVNLKNCSYDDSEIVNYVTRHRDLKISLTILEEQNKALKTCKSEDLAPEIEGMVFIKAGELEVGTPKQKIKLDPYYIDKYEVTNLQYEECVSNGQCKRSLYKGNRKFNKPNYPIVGVDWNSAKNFCLSLQKRLPGEYEWEWAAMGAQAEVDYPEIGALPAIANYKDNTSYQKPTRKVGNKSANDIGLYDMIGNVSEWVNDWYDLKYYHNIPYQNPKGPVNGTKKVHRGGNWSMGSSLLVPINRSMDYVTKRRNTLGFRCARNYREGN